MKANMCVLQVLLNYLRALDMIDPSFYSKHALPDEGEQIFLEITEGPAAKTDDFVMDGAGHKIDLASTRSAT